MTNLDKCRYLCDHYHGQDRTFSSPSKIPLHPFAVSFYTPGCRQPQICLPYCRLDFSFLKFYVNEINLSFKKSDFIPPLLKASNDFLTKVEKNSGTILWPSRSHMVRLQPASPASLPPPLHKPLYGRTPPLSIP